MVLERKYFAVKFTLEYRSRVTFEFFVGLFVVYKYIHFVMVASLVHNNNNTTFVSW